MKRTVDDTKVNDSERVLYRPTNEKPFKGNETVRTNGPILFGLSAQNGKWFIFSLLMSESASGVLRLTNFTRLSM